ncbi:MAG: hypothetical protein PHH70_01680 [Candidatus Gracilibacteria bacterium]|nr:hypothetical protein [Candidatus Gracilibacteria bacterium]
MSYDINLYFRNSETGEMINPYSDDDSYNSENQSIQEKQYKRNLKVARLIEKRFPDIFQLIDDAEKAGVSLEVREYEKIGMFLEFDGDLLTLYIHFSDLSISDDEHAQYISEIIWIVSEEEDCIIDDPQIGLVGIPSRIFSKTKDGFSAVEIYEYTSKEDYFNHANVGGEKQVGETSHNTISRKSGSFWRIFFIILMIVGIGAKFTKSYLTIEKFEENKKHEIEMRYANVTDKQVIPHAVTIDLGTNYSIHRPAELGEYSSLTWVIEDQLTGKTLLKRNAEKETSYTYYRNFPGMSYRVYLDAFINGEYQRISNVIEYIIP